MPRASADERLERLLAIVPWVAAHDGPEVTEVCARFGITEAELIADLELLWMCGLYPYTPDVLVEVDIADGRVWIRYADFFRRPLRLTPAEGLALLSAGSAFLAVPGSDPDGPLARALGKLATLLGVEADETVEVELAPVAPEVLGVVQRGTAAQRALEIDYYSFGRDEQTVRRVDPWDVFNAAGQWYLDGWCHRAGGRRLFRVDRIRHATLLDDAVAHAKSASPGAGHMGTPALYSPRPEDPVVTLDLGPAAAWVAEKYPMESVDPQPGGRLRVRLRSSEQAWLERLLLRLGPDAEVVDGPAGIMTIRAEAANRLLARYRSGGATEREPGSTLAAP